MKLVAERKDVDRRIERLVAALEAGGDIASVVVKLRDLERRKTAIAEEVASVQPSGAASCGNRRPKAAPLQRILRGRITFTRVAGGYVFEAPTRFDRLFTA